jgi:hypothetical protein
VRSPRLSAVLLALAALTACARPKAAGKPARELPTAVLVIRNDYSSPLDIFATRESGFIRRIGSVFTGRVERFQLGSDVISAGPSLRIVATVRGGRGSASTGQLTVQPGDTVQFNIGSDLRSNSVFIR